MSSKKYYKNLDLIRVIALFAILLYHLKLLKGGFLAVPIFFVLSAYLSVKSLFKNDKVSLKEYYKKLFFRIYLPLIIVIFISIGAISFFSNIIWLNLKPETNSVILGLNNFWQLSINLDYFKKQISSPFMHMWYISILIQFDLILPFLFIGLKKLKEKFNALTSCITITSLSIIMTIYFYFMYQNVSIMNIYYNTFTRVFSLLFGASLGFIHEYYNNKVYKSLNKNKNISYIYLVILVLLFVFVDYKSIFMPLSMILTTLITCRLIDYSIYMESKNLSIFDKIIKFISKISYEVYLVQYPIIFIFQYININRTISILLIIALVFIVSFIINIGLDKNSKLMKLIFPILLLFTIYGFYIYFITEDHTKEMNDLKLELSKNEEIIKQKQEEYKNNLKKDEDDLFKVLASISDNEDNLKEYVSNLSIVGVGDSVMLGAINNLYSAFKNGYFDAKISRTAWVVNSILIDLKNNNMLGDIIVLNLGANGDCDEKCKNEILETCDNREIFWLNTTNDIKINETLLNFSNNHDNVHLIDWKNISNGHSEYFISDGIHLTEKGKEAYTNTIYNEIYNFYLNKYETEKETILNKYEESINNKITFYGNDILLNDFDYLKDNFSDSNFNIKKDYNYNTLINDIKTSKENNTITKRVVIALDNSINLSLDEYKNIIESFNDSKVYIISFNDIKCESNENLTVIDLSSKLNYNENFMPDKIHLNNLGNEIFNELLIQYLK